MTYNPDTTIFTVPNTNAIWAGVTFDNNNGTTGASAADLNNIGQLLYKNATVGFSDDVFFQTNTAGSYAGDNPVGGYYYFGGNPVANFAWQFTSASAVPAPGAFGVFVVGGLGGFGLMRRRTHAGKA